MKLVIVESPSKTKTIKQYLGSDYEVLASKGHIRDIQNTGKDNLGLDFNNNLKPIYTILPGQYQTIKTLKNASEEAEDIYLATDPDREGEAISWHLKEVLGLNGKNVHRIEFNEITKPAILAAISSPRDIDMPLVSSQETRKIIDRIIGFKLSTLLKRSIASESAGRVQSVALKIITDKEEEINAFVAKKYCEIEAETEDFIAKLKEPEKNKIYSIEDRSEAEKIFKELKDTLTLSSLNENTRSDKPQPPFTTSTLIQAASNRFSLSSAKTMSIAQGLYEGTEIASKHIALITYMRTDSTRISDVFKSQLSSFIVSKYGKEYLGYTHMQKASDNVQDAHEAIRPVSLEITPDYVKEYLTKDQYNLYNLIYSRTVSSMMRDAKILTLTALFDNNSHTFQASFEKVLFEGYQKAQIKSMDAKPKFYLDAPVGTIFKIKKLSILDKETQGPERYSEATLIKKMEDSGIGRPSTYASTISTLKNRKYISVQKKKLIPTDQGKITSDFLHDYFDMIINVEYTARMEKTLDEIASGEKEEDKVVNQFYNAFDKILSEKKKDIKPMETGELCPKCGSKMIYKINKYGRFEACSNYPSCKYIKKTVTEEEKIPYIECPLCHEGHLVLRTSSKGRKAGKKFYGCSSYPKCTFTISSLSEIKKM
ncbi:MAG: type I DNA topoisomerase [Bacillales bacterium]|nr:type I DNA topoisomerase [Bacillales bacterium]